MKSVDVTTHFITKMKEYRPHGPLLCILLAN